MDSIRTTAILASSFLVIVAAGCGATSPTEPVNVASSGTTSNPGTTTAAEPATEEAPPSVPDVVLPEPAGEIESSCQYILDFNQGHTFVVSATVSNTGNIGIVTRVTATFRQAGTKPVIARKTVKVKVGGERDVEMTVKASSHQIDLIQAVAADRQCKVTSSITDTFGDAT